MLTIGTCRTISTVDDARGGRVEAITAIDHRIGQIHQLIASLSTRPASSAGTTVLGSSGALASSASLFSGTGSLAAFSDGASFSELLAAAQTGGTSLAAAAAQFNADGVPRALAGYGNGRIPEAALGAISGSNERMWGPAAEQLSRLLSDAKAAGVTIGVTDGYRSYDDQVRIANEKGLYSQGGLAAQPGTSEHGWGLAADLQLNPTAQAWMRQHAKDYGFVENVPREPWHWEFQPANV